MAINLGQVEKKNNAKKTNGLNLTINRPQNAQRKKWFSSGAFNDGYQFGDITKTVASTATDVGLNLAQGVVRAGESIGDLAAYGGAQIVDWLGNENYANQVRQAAAEDLTGKIFNKPNENIDKNSVLGEKADDVISSIGNMYAQGVTSTKLLGTKGNIPLNVAGKKFNMPVTSIVSGASSNMAEAVNKGAEDWQIWLNGVTGGISEGISESLFGTFGIGGSDLDDALVKSITGKMKNSLAKNLTKLGIKAGGEGTEEIVSYLLNYATSNAMDYVKNKTGLKGPDIAEEFNSEELWDNFIGGALAAGFGGLPSTINSIRDVNNNLDVTEGTNQFNNQNNNSNQVNLPQANLQESIVNDAVNARIEQNNWQSMLKNNTTSVPINSQNGIVNANSYRYIPTSNIKINNFRKSASQYFNNSTQTQNFLNTIEKVIADKDYGVVFDDSIVNTRGESVNAQISTENGETIIKLNPNSDRAGEFLLVHEITHAIETDSMKQLVLDFASKNPEFNQALESLKQTYGTNDVTSEVVADISGQLLGNQEFINSLTTQNTPQSKSIIRQIYESIRRLLNNLTESGRYKIFVQDLEAKWREAYRTTSSEQTINNLNDGTQYHLSSTALSEVVDTLQNPNTDINSLVKLRDYTPQILVENGVADLPMMVRKGHLRENILTEQEALNRGFSVKGKHYHGLGVNIYLQAIDSLDNPVAIYQYTNKGKYNTDNYVVLTSVTDSNGNYIIVPIEINKRGQYNSVEIDINRIKTVYGRETQNYFDNKVANNELKEIYSQKRSAIPSVQFGSHSTSSANNIPQSTQNVNSDTSTRYSMQEEQNDVSYRGEHQPDRMGVGYDLTSEGIIDDSIYTNPEWYVAMSEKSYQESFEVLNRVRNNPNADVTIYRATPSTEINPGDWITLSKTYAQEHLARSLDNKGNVVEKVVKAKDIQWAGDDINEFGYFPDGDIQNSISNKTWQEHLEQNYQSSGTRINMPNIKIPTQQDIQNTQNNNINLPPVNRVLNPVEISQLTPEDANTRPFLPKDPTRESSYEDASLEEIAQILDEKPVTEKQKDNRAKVFLTTKFLDKGYYVDKLARQYKNRELSAKYDYSLLHNGIANEIIGNGRYDSEGNKIGKSLYEIFAPIEESNLTGEFSEYLYHLHNIDRMSLNKTHSEDNKPVFGKSVTAERSQEIVNKLLKKYPEFEAYAQDIYDYNNANLQMLVDNGVISKEDMDYYNKKYPHYVPIIRNNANTRNQMIYLAGKAATVGVPIKKAKGGNSDIIPLKEAMAMRTMQTVNSALKNDFGLELLHTIYGENTNEVVETAQSLDETIDEMDSAKIVEPKTSDREATFTVYQNGKKITMEISDEIYEALTPRKTGTIKPLHAFNNFRRAVLTEYNPAFVISNILKDVQDGSYNSKHPAQFLKNIPEATSQLKNKGKLYQLYIANGGGQDTYFNYDSGTNVKSKRKYVPTGNKLLDTIKLPLKILDKISDINQAVEMTPRLAEFIASLEAGDSIQTAMYNAQEITTNFKRGGDFTKTLDKNGVTFLNAGTQGFLKQIRNVQDAKVNGLRGIANLGVRALFWGTSWMLLNDLIWGDDEDYEELSDYVKNNYYIIGKYGDGNFIRIPKGRVVSIIQKSFEEVWDGLTGKDVDIDQLADLVQNQVLPSDPTENNIFSPLVQAFGSENGEAWYGGDLVPSRLQDLPVAEQYDESTDSFSIWLGNLLNVSPYKINYVLDQYSGVIGDLTLPYLTKEAETSGIIAPLKDKFTTNSTLNNQNASDFYDLKDELQKQSNSSKATDEDKLKYKYINYINSQTSELYKQKREIQNSSLSDDEKMSKIKEIQNQINDLTKTGINNYENVETFENYGKVADVEFYLNSENEWERVKEEEQAKLEKLRLTSEEKNTYFEAKVESGIIRNDDSKDSTVKHQEISNVILGTGFDDEKIAYLYSRYYSSEETLNNLIEMRIPIKEFIKFDSQEFEGDYNTRTGQTISGSRKNKVIQYVNSLNLSIPQKAILIKMEYNSYDNYNNQIVNYINNLDKTANDKKVLLKTIGFDNFNKDVVEYINSQNISIEEKEEKLKELGFTVRNGRVYW